MPAPKFERDGTPRISYRERLLIAFGQMTPEEFQAGVNISVLRREIVEKTGANIRQTGFYEAYRTLLKEQKKGTLPDGIKIPEQQETHSKDTGRRVADLREQGFSHTEIAERLYISESRSRIAAFEAGATRTNTQVTVDELDRFSALWAEGLKQSQIIEQMGLTRSRFNHLYSVLRQEERLESRVRSKTLRKVQRRLILSLSRQGFAPADVEQILKDMYGYKVTRDIIYTEIYNLRLAGKLPHFSTRRELYSWKRENNREYTTIFRVQMPTVEVPADEVSPVESSTREKKMRRTIQVSSPEPFRVIEPVATPLPTPVKVQPEQSFVAQREEMESTKPETSYTEISAVIKKKMVDLIRQGGIINFVTDNRGFAISRIGVKVGRQYHDAYAKASLTDFGRVTASTLNYTRQRRSDGSLVASLIFNDQIAKLVYNRESQSINLDGSPHAPLLMRALEYLRSVLLLQIKQNYNNVDTLPDDLIPSVKELIAEAA